MIEKLSDNQKSTSESQYIYSIEYLYGNPTDLWNDPLYVEQIEKGAKGANQTVAISTIFSGDYEDDEDGGTAGLACDELVYTGQVCLGFRVVGV